MPCNVIKEIAQIDLAVPSMASVLIERRNVAALLKMEEVIGWMPEPTDFCYVLLRSFRQSFDLYISPFPVG
jgi:hypothetical protein